MDSGTTHMVPLSIVVEVSLQQLEYGLFCELPYPMARWLLLTGIVVVMDPYGDVYC